MKVYAYCRGFQTPASPLKPRRAPLSGEASFQYLSDLVVWVAMLILRQRLIVWDSPRAFSEGFLVSALDLVRRALNPDKSPERSGSVGDRIWAQAGGRPGPAAGTSFINKLLTKTA